MIRYLIFVLAALFPLGPAFGEEVTLNGSVRVGATGMRGGEGIGQADLLLGFDLFRRLPLGVELGFYGFAGKAGRPHETYAALVWNDRLRVGATRSAYDTVLTSPFDRTAPFLAEARVEYTRALVTVEPIRRDAVPWGISYSGHSGQTRWTVSAHRAGKGDFTAAALALFRKGPGWTLAAALEGVTSGGSARNGINAKLGGTLDFGLVRAGLAYLHPDANRRPDAVALDLAFSPIPHLALLAFGEFTLGGSDDAYGVAADFLLRDSTSWVVSATHDTGGDAVHVTLEQRF